MKNPAIETIIKNPTKAIAAVAYGEKGSERKTNPVSHLSQDARDGVAYVTEVDMIAHDKFVKYYFPGATFITTRQSLENTSLIQEEPPRYCYSASSNADFV